MSNSSPSSSQAPPPCVLFLLDWHPVFWSTREEYYRQLSQALTQRGIQPVMIVSAEPAPEVTERFTAAGARVIARSYHAEPLAYWADIRKVAREYQVRIAHVRFFDYFTAVLWMCRLAGIRTVMFTEANSGEWRGRGWKAALLRLRTKLMCWPVTRMIAISNYIRDRMVAVGIDRRIITVVYNGVDVSSFRPDAAARSEVRREMGAGEQTIVMIYAAVLRGWKRPDVALRVCAELHKRDKDVQLWMAGTGEMREELGRLAERLGITGQVKWLGYQREPQRWMAGADVFLHLAVGEAFGNVFVEAMACGLPSVASRSGAAPELVVESVTGRLVDPGSPDEVERLADAVVEVGCRTKQQAMGAAAIQQSKRFRTETAVEQTMEVYRGFLR